jgi:cytochrome c peroxidase
MAIDAQEAETVRILRQDMRFGKLMARLGQALVFDKSLSVNRNEACAFCHNPATGFNGGGISEFAKAGGVMPGSVPWRTGPRVPQSMAYAAFAPALTLKPDGTFVGGNFWDGRATGEITGSAAGDQALDALTSPTEMALPDPACAVRRVALAPYGKMFGRVWGNALFAVTWPPQTDKHCGQPNNGGVDQSPLQLDASSRARAVTAFHQIGLTVAAYEISPLASPFTSKFDAVQAGRASFTAQERLGYNLFIGKAHCASCHSVASRPPLFTDFAFHNIGLVANDTLPFLDEGMPDAMGYRANQLGRTAFDRGFGGFLLSDKNDHQDWRPHASFYLGAFQTPTLRNVSARAGFHDRVFMHNGQFKSVNCAVEFSTSSRSPDPSQRKNGEFEALIEFLHTLDDGG